MRNARSTAALSSALGLAVLLGACAPMTENQCRSADWYQIGYHDADPYGLQPQFFRYENECKAWVQASQSDYMRGWQEGYWEYTKKMTGSECCGSR